MSFKYTPEEIDVLIQDYRLTLEASEDRRYSIAAIDLLDQEKSLAYFEKVADIFEATTRSANVSLYSKRYSFMILASSLYAMSRYDKSLDYSIANCHIESYHQGKAWLPKVRLAEWNVSLPEEGCRNQWRDRVIRNVFAGNLGKAWRAISKATSTPISVLWENTAIYVHWLYENKFAEGADPIQQARIEADYRYLCAVAPAELFGESKNPLTQFDSPKVITRASDKPIRLRKTCCLYYQASDEPHDYCGTCPKIKHELVSAELSSSRS